MQAKRKQNTEIYKVSNGYLSVSYNKYVLASHSSLHVVNYQNYCCKLNVTCQEKWRVWSHNSTSSQSLTLKCKIWQMANQQQLLDIVAQQKCSA